MFVKGADHFPLDIHATCYKGHSILSTSRVLLAVRLPSRDNTGTSGLVHFGMAQFSKLATTSPIYLENTCGVDRRWPSPPISHHDQLLPVGLQLYMGVNPISMRNACAPSTPAVFIGGALFLRSVASAGLVCAIYDWYDCLVISIIHIILNPRHSVNPPKHVTWYKHYWKVL